CSQGRGTFVTYSLSLHDALPIYEKARADYLRLLQLPPGETNTVMFQKSASASGTMQITTAQSGLSHVLLNSVGMCEYYLGRYPRSEEHTSELQSRENLVCRLLLE